MSPSSLETILRRKQHGWRRRHERHRADFPIKVTVLGENGYSEIFGRCGDIGHGGMGVVLIEEISKDEVLSLEFSLPTRANPLLVRSIVRYRKGFLHGLEFLGLSTDQQAVIDAFCSGLPPSA